MMEKQKLAFLWDMDGTLIDTKDCHYECWRESMRAFGYELEKDVFEKNFGRKSTVVIPLYLGSDSDEVLVNQILEDYRKRLMGVMVERTSLVPGVLSWLQEIKNLRIPQVVASSAAAATLDKILAAYDLQDYFEGVFAGAELPAKPNPDLFLLAAKTLGCAPENCCVIEDSPAGVKAAKAAGMRCVAVLTSFSRSRLSMADKIIEDFTVPFSDVMNEVGLYDPAHP